MSIRQRMINLMIEACGQVVMADLAMTIVCIVLLLAAGVR